MKAVVIGAGHNGLVAAFYLAKAGWTVDIFEAQQSVGGPCASIDLHCGCRVPIGPNQFGMLRPEIRRAFGLDSSLDVIIPDPQMVVSFDDGESIGLYRDEFRTAAEIARFSKADSKRYRDYTRDLRLASSILKQILLGAAPSKEEFAEKLGRIGSGFDQLFLRGSIGETVAHYFSDPRVQTTFVAATILYKASPRDAGTAFSLLYLSQFDIGGQPVWGFIRGGMGEVTLNMAECVRRLGVRIHTNESVRRIRVHGGQAAGIELGSGQSISADVVLSSADPYTTLVKLIPPGSLPSNIECIVRERDFDGCCSRLNLLVRNRIRYSQLAVPHAFEGPKTFTVVCKSIDALDLAHQECMSGRTSLDPYLEIVCPSQADHTITCGHDILSVLVLYTPYQLSASSWEIERSLLQERIIVKLDRLSPGLKDAIDWVELATPIDLEHRFHMWRGNIDHGDMSPDNILSARPYPGIGAGGLTTINNLYICGAGSHPGGLISGAPGYNSAVAILDRYGSTNSVAG